MTLDEARCNIGEWVQYERPFTKIEHGVITKVTQGEVVFVHYLNDMYPKGTNPEGLTLVTATRKVRQDD